MLSRRFRDRRDAPVASGWPEFSATTLSRMKEFPSG
jgi:hypothetical protein